MIANNYQDVLDQLLAAGLIVSDLQLNTPRPVHCFVKDDREKRGWYWLKEWSPSIDRTLIVGSFGVWRGTDANLQKVELSIQESDRVTPEQRAAMQRVWKEAAKAAELQRNQEAAAAARMASRAWARLQLDGESPYLAEKGVAGYGLRYTEHGTAVVPVTDTGGKIHGLQFIRTAAQAKEGKRPKKEFWPRGMVKKGHFHILGHQPDWIVLVAEGYATAATLHAATGYPVACAFDAGNLLPVADALRKRYKRAKILICADDDCWTEGNPGITAASTAAISVAGEWIRPIFSDEEARQQLHTNAGRKLTDFNDLFVVQGMAAVYGQVSTRLSDLKWNAPVSRAVSSSDTTGQGKLRPLQFLDELLERFAVLHGSAGAVFDRREHALMTLADVRNICARSDLYKAWMEHPDRDIIRTDDVVFEPASTDPALCNLWGGWPTSPKAGKCEILLDLLQYMCSGERNSRALFDWVLRWLAYPIQFPGAKMKSTIVVHGPQGTGKNQFFEAVMQIYGKYGRILDQDSLVDKHNDWVSRKLFLIADEVVAQAHRFEVKNKLKTLITGNWLRINPKHVAAYDEANHVNLVFLSNESMPVVLEEDDRRHCVIWTPPKKTGTYYADLIREIESGGIAALHEYLLNVDLGDFHPGTWPPYTQAKQELIDLAQDSPVDFFDALYRLDLAPLKPMPGLTTDWFVVYQRWCQRVGIKAASLKRFVNSLERRRDTRTARKGWLNGQQVTHPASMLLFSLTPPDGVVESTWLGEQIPAMKSRMQDYVGGNPGNQGGYG